MSVVAVVGTPPSFLSGTSLHPVTLTPLPSVLTHCRSFFRYVSLPSSSVLPFVYLDGEENSVIIDTTSVPSCPPTRPFLLPFASSLRPTPMEGTFFISVLVHLPFLVSLFLYPALPLRLRSRTDIGNDKVGVPLDVQDVSLPGTFPVTYLVLSPLSSTLDSPFSLVLLLCRFSSLYFLSGLSLRPYSPSSTRPLDPPFLWG